MEKYMRGQAHVHLAWQWIGERGLRVVTGAATLAFHATLLSKKLHEIEDMIPAGGSLLLVLRPGTAVSAGLRVALAASLADTQAAIGKQHEIVVEYGGTVGADLPALAERAGMDTTTYINGHAAVDYTVAFLGFQPGFPYLRGLPHALHAPRRASPRVQVAPGSVAIGGAYTGIYPAGGPAGWQIIGRTAAVIFDPQREMRALLAPGDRVRFVAK